MKSMFMQFLRTICTLIEKRKVKTYGKGLKVNFPCKFTSEVL